jgi:hypothetical protein
MGRYVYAGYQNVKTGSAKRTMFRVPIGTGACFYNTNWIVPTNVNCATFEIWGGGGAGAPNCCCNCSQGHAGSAGGYSLRTISVTPGDSYSITVGAGGCGNECWYNGNACGCAGGITYVTGTGLSNFCATGGQGGTWCNSSYEGGTAGVGYGGDLNLRGKQGRSDGCCSQGCAGTGLGGAAPFGGGWQIHPRGVGACSTCLACGPGGIFPGGGGLPRPGYTPGWCDCCAGCSGPGGDGLVIITL